MRISLLDQMRMARDEREARALEPYVNNNYKLYAELQHAHSQRKALEKLISNKMYNEIVNEMSYNFSNSIKKHFITEIAKSTPNERNITISFDKFEIGTLINGSLENRLMNEYRIHFMENMSVNMNIDHICKVQILQFHIPKFQYNRAIEVE